MLTAKLLLLMAAVAVHAGVTPFITTAGNFSGRVKDVDGQSWLKLWQIKNTSSVPIFGNAFGDITEDGVTEDAWMSNAQVNAFKGRVYRLEFFNSQAQQWMLPLFLRTARPFDASQSGWGLAHPDTEMAQAAVYSSSLPFVPLRHKFIDSLSISGESCNRFFVGQGSKECFLESGVRCATGGWRCAGYARHTKVVVYKSLPVNCAGAWSEFSECSASCSGGSQTRTFTVSVNADGGSACTVTDGDIELKSCNSDECPIGEDFPLSGQAPFKGRVEEIDGKRWAKLLQFAESVVPTSDAVGNISNSGDAKLSDAQINSLGFGSVKTYRLNLITPQNATVSVFIRTNRLFNDLSASWNLADPQTMVAVATKWDDALEFTNLKSSWLDTGNDDCNRVFIGHNQFDCYGEPGVRCVHSGHYCGFQKHRQVSLYVQLVNDCDGSWSYYGSCSTQCGKGTQTRSFVVKRTRSGLGAACNTTHGLTESQSCEEFQCTTPPSFSEFVTLFGKQYNSSELAAKQQSYEANIAFIQNQNSNFDSPLFGFGPFVDLSPTEFRSYYMYDFPYNASAPKGRKYVALSSGALPTNFDWSTRGAVTPVKNQGSCGSCWTYGATHSVEGSYFIAKGKLHDFSQKALLDCGNSNGGTINGGNVGTCSGGWPWHAITFIAKYSIPLSSTYTAYNNRRDSCNFNKYANKPSLPGLRGYTHISSETDMKRAIVESGPIAMGCYGSPLQSYSSGIIRAPACNAGSDPNYQHSLHAVTIVGFGVENGRKFWKVKNSWGANWGEKGYFRMERDVNCIGISSLKYSQIVNVDADCKGAWGTLGSCTANCGTGSQSRTYTVSKSATGNGNNCGTADGAVYTQTCNTQDCDTVGEYCQIPSTKFFDFWSAGWYTHMVAFPAAKGKRAPVAGLYYGYEVSHDTCKLACDSTVGCAAVVWRFYGAGTCSGKTCQQCWLMKSSASVIVKDYSSSYYASMKGACVPCGGSWAGYGSCTKSCATGQQTRTYSVTTTPGLGGTPCPADQTRVCSTSGCPVHCAGSWSAYSSCSKTCLGSAGMGYQTRTYSITTNPSNGGTSCPADDTRACNTFACPVNCAGSWASYGTCSKTCGSGTHTRTFTITTNPSGGGTTCPADQTQTCNTASCPSSSKGWAAMGYASQDACLAFSGGACATSAYPTTQNKACWQVSCCNSASSGNYVVPGSTCQCIADCTYSHAKCDGITGDSGLAIRVHTTDTITDPITVGGNVWLSGTAYYKNLQSIVGESFCATSNINHGNSVQFVIQTTTKVWMIRHTSGTAVSTTGWTQSTAGYYINAIYSGDILQLYYKVFSAGTHTLDTDSAMYIFEPQVNCAGSWASYGTCSKTCGSGTQTRTYSITTNPSGGGTVCPSGQTQSCNTAACPQQTSSGFCEDVKSVRVYQYYGTNDLVVGELQLFDASGSQISGLSATATSSVGTNSPSKAIDGTTSGGGGSYYVGNSDTVGSQYLTVTLGTAQTLKSFKLYGRTDCCYERQSKQKVEFRNAAGAVVTYFENVNAGISPYNIEVQCSSGIMALGSHGDDFGTTTFSGNAMVALAEPFQHGGFVTRWSYSSKKTTTGLVTPVLVTLSGGVATVSGVGTTRTHTTAGFYEFDFAAVSGSTNVGTTSYLMVWSSVTLIQIRRDTTYQYFYYSTTTVPSAGATFTVSVPGSNEYAPSIQAIYSASSPAPGCIDFSTTGYLTTTGVSGAQTAEAWVKISNSAGLGTPFLGNSFWTDKRWGWYIGPSTVYSAQTGGPTVYFNTGTSPTDGTWHHIAFAGTKMYVDGVVALSAVNNYLNQKTDMWLGNYNGRFSCCSMAGSLEVRDFRLWSTVRTQAQVVAAKDGTISDATGLLTRLLFSDNVVDATGNLVWIANSVTYPSSCGV